MSNNTSVSKAHRLGIAPGSSGLVGATIVNYFKSKTAAPTKAHAPGSKKHSTREPADIRNYLFSVSRISSLMLLLPTLTLMSNSLLK